MRPTRNRGLTLLRFPWSASTGFTTISVSAGSLFIYASTTDNKTNDSAIKFLSTATNQ
jgi:hypothetical protein